MRKRELAEAGLGLLTIAATTGVVLAAIFWWRLHAAWAALLGALTFFLGWALWTATEFVLMLKHLSSTVPCPRCRRTLYFWSLRADGKPVYCPTCGVLSTRTKG